MRQPSGTLHIADFQSGEIVSALQSSDYWDDKRHWEIKNNVDILDFTVFDGTEQAATLMQQNLVLKEVSGGRIVPYVIDDTAKSSDGRSLTVYASAEWVLLKKAGVIKPQRFESKTARELTSIALAGTKYEIGFIEYSGFHTMTIDEFIDPLKFLKDIAALFDLEIVFRVEVIGSRIVGRYVDMVQRRGKDTGKEVTLGKDLKGIVRRENSSNICTALVGFVRGENDKLITVESINNGLPYIVDSSAFQRWNENGQHKFGFYTPETEDQNMTPERLMALMKIEFKKRMNSTVQYEVDAIALDKIFGLSHEEVAEGDIIRIKDTGFTPKLYLIARAIAGDESFTNPSENKYVFGDYIEVIDTREEMLKLYNKIRNSLWDKASNEALKLLEKQVEDTSSGFNERLIAMKTSLEQTDESIRLNAQAVNQKMEKLSSTLDVNAREIKAKVGKGDIASELNITPQSVLINSELIDLVGKVKAEWLIAGLLEGMTIKTSNTKEHIHMQNQVLKFVNQGVPKMIMGFENEYNSSTFNPYITFGQGDGTGRNVGTIYKDGGGLYLRFIDLNGAESNIRLTAQGNIGITAQTSMWLNSKGSLVVDGEHGVSMNHAGKTVVEVQRNNSGDNDLTLGGNHMIRSSTAKGYDKLLQIKNVFGNEFRGLEVSEITAHGGIRSDTNLWAEQNSYAIEHINRSTEKIKASIHDLPFSPLEKIRGLKVKKYVLKKDMYDLYQMRMNKPVDRVEPYTTADIETYYGLIAEETDDIFTTPEKDGIKDYATLSILTAAVQELDQKHDAEIQALKESHQADMESMNTRVEALEKLVQKLIS
ncbi:phage tail protein [Bacillus cereus group sp. TH43LC]|uniref:phage tail spike protein n=1 Tax=Bacillus cereus group TaxID=86661 RepID=UPI0022E89E69|nr:MULTISPECIES: phage tail spike protein [Bacillus cereus group]MDA1504851.1 phage tail protein [Bacillus cereus group sp. TH43LC]MDA1541941.1 phage tail protein [Bacillus cereus group sp. TH244-1LC]MDA1862701.1 phage tail protein [Bacillus cereus group sp. BY128LC]MDK7437916.1 phage tail protein [Bacillus paranthracis]MDK7503093.1 phage tail protein [Bacillus paranthracis]